MAAASPRRVTTGLVLRTADTKEADKILTVLTPDMGKIAVSAKGARSRRSRVSAACQLLAWSEMTLSESRGWQYLVEANTIALFDGVRQDLERLALASYFAELADAVTYEDLPAAEVLSLLLNALFALSEQGRPPALVKPAFELRLMALTGYAPQAEGCPRCGAAVPVEPALDIANGQVCCGGCAPDAVPLGEDALAALRYVLTCPAKRLYAFSLPPEALARLDRAAEDYVRFYLEREMGALDFYRSLQRPFEHT